MKWYTHSLPRLEATTLTEPTKDEWPDVRPRRRDRRMNTVSVRQSLPSSVFSHKQAEVNNAMKRKRARERERATAASDWSLTVSSAAAMPLMPPSLPSLLSPMKNGGNLLHLPTFRLAHFHTQRPCKDPTRGQSRIRNVCWIVGCTSSYEVVSPGKSRSFSRVLEKELMVTLSELTMLRIQ